MAFGSHGGYGGKVNGWVCIKELDWVVFLSFYLLSPLHLIARLFAYMYVCLCIRMYLCLKDQKEDLIN